LTDTDIKYEIKDDLWSLGMMCLNLIDPKLSKEIYCLKTKEFKWDYFRIKLKQIKTQINY